MFQAIDNGFGQIVSVAPAGTLISGLP